MKIGSKTRLFIIICLSIFLQCADGYAGTFAEIRRDENNLIYLDISSLADKGEYVTAWAKWISRGANLKEQKKVYGEKYAFSMINYAYNKKVKELQLLYGYAYSKDGTILFSHKEDFSSYKYVAAVPGSYGELLWERVMALTNH